MSVDSSAGMTPPPATRFLAAALLLTMAVLPAAAQDVVTSNHAALTPSVTLVTPFVDAGALTDIPIAASAAPNLTDDARPRLLMPLYVSAGALQVLDLYTTSRGLKAGAVETNAAVGSGVGGRALAVKAATTAAGIVLAEKLWRRNKAAAMTAMLVTNAVSAAVVANNYSVIRQLERR